MQSASFCGLSQISRWTKLDVLILFPKWDRALGFVLKRIAEEFWSITDEVLTDEVLTDEVLTDEVLTDEVLTDEVLTDEVLTDEVLTDEVLTDEVLTDEVLIRTNSMNDIL